MELERCGDAAQRAANVYQFYDLWRLHPDRHQADLAAAYAAILQTYSKKNWPFDDVLAKRYTVRQGAWTDIQSARYSRDLPRSMNLWPTLRRPLAPWNYKGRRVEGEAKSFGLRGRKVVKLGDIAEVKIGLQSGDNGRFYRAAAGVKGGATKGGYKEVPVKQIVTDAGLPR